MSWGKESKGEAKGSKRCILEIVQNEWKNIKNKEASVLKMTWYLDLYSAI